MTIYSDNAGNYFLGDCIWANHDINFPTTKFLQAHPYSSISAELSALCTASGLKFRNVATQAMFDAGLNNNSVLAFGANSDTIDDRYTINQSSLGSMSTNATSSGSRIPVTIQMYNNSGYSQTNNTINNTNAILGVAQEGFASHTNVSYTEATWRFSSPFSDIQCSGVSDGESLGLVFSQANLPTMANSRLAFFYAGIVDDVNTGFNYYSADITTKSVLLCKDYRTNNLSIQIYAGHRIANTGKLCLTTGDAQYSIACSDGQSPTAQWATDMYVFDNNATLGYPAIGKVRNLLLAQGSYTIGKPVRIQGTVQPDNGFNCWLPVGQFAGKWVLMRCYSSVDL